MITGDRGPTPPVGMWTLKTWLLSTEKWHKTPSGPSIELGWAHDSTNAGVQYSSEYMGELTNPTTCLSCPLIDIVGCIQWSTLFLPHVFWETVFTFDWLIHGDQVTERGGSSYPPRGLGEDDIRNQSNSCKDHAVDHLK